MTDWHSIHGDFFSDQRVLVTGGAGFIGSHLTHALIQLGATVVVLDDLCGGDRANLDSFACDQLEFIEGSILDEALLARCTQNSNFVFHQAALGSVPRSVAEPRLFQEVNVTGTLNILEAARAAGVNRVIFAASSSAYGDSETLPKVETMPSLPKSPYAANKLAGEHLMRAYAASYGLDTASLRYFNIFGPCQNANSAYAAVIAAFAKALLSDQHPMIYGDGEQSRDFTYVDNAVHANLLAARSAKPIQGEAINIACGERVSVNKLAELMAQLMDKPQLTATHAPDRAGDVKHSLADLGRAELILGYAPIVDFYSGLRATVSWYSDSCSDQETPNRDCDPNERPVSCG